VEYKFIDDREGNYLDSLGVVLMAEFKDWDAARIAELRITYSWDRVGHHLWKDKKEAEALGKNLDIKMPYRFQELLDKNDEKIVPIINDLRKKMFLLFRDDAIKDMTVKKLLAFAFKNNPDVLKLKQDAILRSNIRRFVAKNKRQPNEEELKKM
jgi:hypothetical protein